MTFANFAVLPAGRCRVFGFILAILAILPGRVLAGSEIRVHDVYPGPAEAVSQAIEAAAPGDVIQLHPGVYKGTVEIRRSGAPERPIVISGLAPGAKSKAVIDGGADQPGLKKRNSGFLLSEVEWVTLQDIELRNCWTDVISLKNSRYISILRCDVIECGQHVVATSGAGTHHVLVEGCTWTQERRVYTTWDWATLHHGEQKYYNGGLYGGGDGAGAVVIRYNNVGYVFNGLRWWLGGESAGKNQYQSNIEIYDNYFHHVRDNVIEPENFTWNLEVYHNRMDSCPRGVFSIDKVKGGEIRIYGNVGQWRQDGALEERAWTVYKSSNYEDGSTALDQPLRIYHNSWVAGNAFARGAKVRKANDHILHYNNAYRHQGEAHLGLIEWPGRFCEFDYDISSAPFHADVTAAGFEAHGIAGRDPKFVAVENDDYRLEPDSPAIDAGRVIDDFTLWYAGRAPDMGAFEDGRLVQGRPFLHRDPPGGALYREKPRVVRIFSRGTALVLFFSTPLDPASLTGKGLGLKAGGQTVAVRGVRFPAGEHAEAAVIDLAAPWPETVTSLELAFAVLPRGANGETATLWAADLRVVRIPENAVLTGVLAQVLGAEKAR